MATVTKEMLKEERKKAGFSVKETAGYLGISAGTLYAYEGGTLNIPETRQEQIRELFDISDRYPETKTEEGYPDPTAAKAIKEVKISTIQPSVGRIYEILSNKKDRNRAILIMSVSEEFVTGCMVYTRPWSCSYPEMAFSTGRFVIDISEIRRFSVKSIDTHRSCDLPQCWKDFNIIKSKLATRLGLQTQIEKPVEKIVEVEKVVEKPVYKEVTDPLKDAVFTVYNDILERLGGK